MRDMHQAHRRGLAGRQRDDIGGHGESRGHHDERRGRRFEGGHIKLLTLHILAEEPRLGYEVIRAIGELVGGDYTPSPGTIYPTLTYLEDKGLASAEQLDNGRRRYALTEDGQTELAAQKNELARLLEHLAHGRNHARARRVPDIQRAMENLKTALRLRFDEELPAAEEIRRIAEIIDRAAVDIGRA